MKLHYYEDTDSLYIDLREMPSLDSREIAPGVVLDFGDDGSLVGIDIDHASRVAELSRLENIGVPFRHHSPEATRLKQGKEPQNILDYVFVTSNNFSNPLRAAVVDFGLGGIQLASVDPLPEHGVVDIAVGRGAAAPWHLICEVRSSRLQNEESLYISGCKFAPRSAEERSACTEYLHALFTRLCANPALPKLNEEPLFFG